MYLPPAAWPSLTLSLLGACSADHGWGQCFSRTVLWVPPFLCPGPPLSSSMDSLGKRFHAPSPLQVLISDKALCHSLQRETRSACPPGALSSLVCALAVAAIMGPQAGQLNPQKGLVSQFWGLQSELAGPPGLVPSEAERGSAPLSSTASGGIGSPWVPWLVNTSPVSASVFIQCSLHISVSLKCVQFPSNKDTVIG